MICTLFGVHVFNVNQGGTNQLPKILIISHFICGCQINWKWKLNCKNSQTFSFHLVHFFFPLKKSDSFTRSHPNGKKRGTKDCTFEDSAICKLLIITNVWQGAVLPCTWSVVISLLSNSGPPHTHTHSLLKRVYILKFHMHTSNSRCFKIHSELKNQQ